MVNPFTVLGVAETATDEMIKQAYLEQVRVHPPERDPQQFQTIRAAFEAIRSRRDRLRYRLLHQQVPTLDSLVEEALRSATVKRPEERIWRQALAASLPPPRR